MDKEKTFSSVPGEYIACGLNTLPDAETCPDTEHEVDVLVPHIGVVRLFCHKKSSRHHEMPRVYWHAVLIVRVLQAD